MTERPLTEIFRTDGEALTLEEYVRSGGYQGLRKALLEMKPEEVTALVKTSNLRGRGGAGFPTGLKWSFVKMGPDAPRPKYIIANADEMEPGTFKDRILMESDPHQFIEGMIIAAYAIGAETAIIFLRWAYKLCERRLNRAIAEAQAAGYLGTNILGSPFSLKMVVHTSAGRYICGEETAMINALEGRRPIPRDKPPHPQVNGLWGQPTIVNNVETLSNVPHIISNGVDWFKSLSRTNEGGTKIYGVSGRVKHPGIYELPMGSTLSEIIEEHAGGMRDGYRLRGGQPGGASTDFFTADMLDLKMDFETSMAAGCRMGTGTIIVLDDKTCPVGFVLNLIRFFAQESCGWCTPCREGLPLVRNILEAMENGQGRLGDIEALERHARLLGPGMTFCALAPGAVEPLGSALRYWREDFERHVSQKRCPWR